ncbi:MAG: hypothetical protein JST81_03390 [Bacteroidetes bacterium]|nr:hypothetical protein [Bacteroidota bacterium]
MTDGNEEIFRRAAEYYPLKTEPVDFSEVLKKMENGGGTPDDPATPAKEKKRRWLFLLFLFLLISPLIIIEINSNGISRLFSSAKKHTQPSITTTNNNEKSTAENKNNHNNQATTVTAAETASPSLAATTTPPAAASNENSTNHGNKAAATTINNVTNTHEQAAYPATAGKTNSGNVQSTNNRQTNTGNSRRLKKKTQPTGNEEHEQLFAQRRLRMFDKGKKHFSATMGETGSDDPVAKENTDDNNIASNSTNNTQRNSTPVQLTTEISPASDSSKQVNTSDSVKSIANAEPKQPDSSNHKKQEEKKKQSKQKHFYAGLVGGPDCSMIKFQSVHKTGYNYGFIVGYALNKRLSVETGLIVDKKSYSSDGKYFSTKKLSYIPSYVKIVYVEGDCHMLEWPVNIYYNFASKKKSNWFASAGISSYFMNKEEYTYEVKRYNVYYPYDATYKTHDNQLAAVVNFSFGYKRSLGKICDLRAEPYLKIPVGKVGTGELPIQSFGLMIGLTKNLF